MMKKEIKLPPKEYYRLEEIADSWNCTVDDLFDYAEQGLLKICIRPTPLINVVCEGLSDDFETVRKRYVTISPPRLPYDLFQVCRTTIRRFRNDLYTSIEGDNYYDFWSPTPIIDHDALHKGKRTIISEWRGTFLKEDMFITNEEKTGFVDMQEKDDIGPRERKTWLKIIYLLSHALADKSANLFNDNNTIICTELERALKAKAEQHGVTTHSMSDDNLGKILKEAKRIIGPST